MEITILTFQVSITDASKRTVIKTSWMLQSQNLLASWTIWLVSLSER